MCSNYRMDAEVLTCLAEVWFVLWQMLFEHLHQHFDFNQRVEANKASTWPYADCVPFHLSK